MLIDTHCHLYKEYYDDLGEVIKRMNGIMIVAGIDDDSNLEVVELVSKYDNIYGVLGFHPSELSKLTSQSIAIIENNMDNPKIVGVGEIGLDYYWNKNNKKEQIEMFEKQIEIAIKYKKPVVIHSREAIQETYDIIIKYPEVKFIMHCYSGSVDMAKRFVSHNILLGIGGVATFQNGLKLKEVIQAIDIEYLLLETDSPYLSPEPYRGKKNEPANAKLVAETIAEIKGISTDKVLEITALNAIRQFDLPIRL